MFCTLLRSIIVFLSSSFDNSPTTNPNLHHSPHGLQTPQQPLMSPLKSPHHQQPYPITHHHHPVAIHQMYSPNGNAYQYQPPPSSQGAAMQPLYANAPPKPKRLTSTSSREGSPNRLEEEEELVNSVNNANRFPHQSRSRTPGKNS